MTNEPATSATETDRWQVSPHVVEQRMGDATVLVHLRSDRILELNETGTRVWELLAAGLSLAEIEPRLAGEFDIDEQSLRAELAAVVRTLADEGVITPHGG